jgi:hypothetical protein
MQTRRAEHTYIQSNDLEYIAGAIYAEKFQMPPEWQDVYIPWFFTNVIVTFLW